MTSFAPNLNRNPALPYPSYPATANERTRWIVERRGPRNTVSPDRPYAFFSEQERAASGEIATVATIFLTNRECPWKCVMCDLWRNTTVASVKAGAIPKQIDFALAALPRASVLKLYNSGSFFDPGAIPKSDWKCIARLCRGFQHVIVECHPRLIAEPVLDFASLLEGTLEVAMGLETRHSVALDALNKRFTVRDYQRATEFLSSHELGIRTFLLVHPPFIPDREQFPWLKRSINFALDCGSTVVSLIPTRAGNGALETLQELGDFREPSLLELEEALGYGVNLHRGRVFADTWDLGRFSRCPSCFEDRLARIRRMNTTQRAGQQIHCTSCQLGEDSSGRTEKAQKHSKPNRPTVQTLRKSKAGTEIKVFRP
ncbi:MAG TPA: radical SAM protein [Verrucomicrobiae bacterium]|nr:radical SAM protein [Verrucomicrobiae bacterium]